MTPRMAWTKAGSDQASYGADKEWQAKTENGKTNGNNQECHWLLMSAELIDMSETVFLTAILDLFLYYFCTFDNVPRSELVYRAKKCY